MRQDVSRTLEGSRLELLRRGRTDGDLQAWEAFQQSLEETVLTWLYEHPDREAACHMHSERYFVALAFEQLRQAAIQGSRPGSRVNRSGDWPTCSITVDSHLRRLCGTAHRNGAMSTRSLVCGVSS